MVERPLDYECHLGEALRLNKWARLNPNLMNELLKIGRLESNGFGRTTGRVA